MTDILNNIHLALPEIIVLSTICVALIADLFLHHVCKSIAFIISMVGLLMAGAVSFLYLGQFHTLLFHGLFISDDIAQIMKLFIYLSVILCFVYAKLYIEERQMPTGDYYILGLLSTLGMMTLVSAHSLLTIYLGLELVSLPLYAMTAIRRTNSDASEAAMKYFVMGAIASGMLLYGISLLYAATGKIDLQEIADVLTVSWKDQSGLVSYALVFILAGVGFKLAAIPFHMWVPDVYAGAPTSVTLFIGTAPKIAALGMALRVLMIGLPGVATQWQQLILVMSLLSVGFGNLIAIRETNIKRLLAYSAISHMGYALFGILAANSSGYASALYYVLIYSIMSSAAFGLVVLMSRSGIEIESIYELKGLNKRNPWLAFMMLIVLLSMAGIPPTVGFFAKLLVLKALVDAHMTWVAVLGLVFAVIGAFYYLRIIKIMYFEDSSDATSVKISAVNQVVFSVNCLSLLFLGMFPGALIALCMNALAA